MSITAKVTCNLKLTYGSSDNRYATVGFMPDYTDNANEEWAATTPHLDLRMTLIGDVADQLEPGKKYTLTFTEDNTTDRSGG